MHGWLRSISSRAVRFRETRNTGTLLVMIDADEKVRHWLRKAANPRRGSASYS
jgi:hypothetical protein